MPPLFFLVSLQLLRETSVFGGVSLPTSSKFSNLTLHFTRCPKVLHKLTISCSVYCSQPANKFLVSTICRLLQSLLARHSRTLFAPTLNRCVYLDSWATPPLPHGFKKMFDRYSEW